MKFGVWLAKCNIYLCYFLHKVTILTPSSHTGPAHTVIWIRFVFTDAQAYFLSEIDEIWCEACIRFIFTNAQEHFLSEIDEIWFEAS